MMRGGTLLTLALFGLAVVPNALPAQRLPRQSRRFLDRRDAVELGLVGGPNRNTVTGAGPVEAKIRGSFGGFLSVALVPGLRLRPELAVSGKQVGTRTEFNQPCLPQGNCPPAVQRETTSFTWLEAPLLLEARLDRALGSWGTPRFYGGPFVAVRLACSFSIPLDPQDQPLEARVVRSCGGEDPSATRYNNGDAGFVVGGTLAVGTVGIGLRWTRSLVPVAPFQAAFNRLSGAKHSTLSVMLELATRLQ